jgi:hypothetical protein
MSQEPPANFNIERDIPGSGVSRINSVYIKVFYQQEASAL